jgi:hypothetical protein
MIIDSALLARCVRNGRPACLAGTINTFVADRNMEAVQMARLMPAQNHDWKAKLIICPPN